MNMVAQRCLDVLQGIQDSLLVGFYFADADLQFRDARLQPGHIVLKMTDIALKMTDIVIQPHKKNHGGYEEPRDPYHNRGAFQYPFNPLHHDHLRLLDYSSARLAYILTASR